MTIRGPFSSEVDNPRYRTHDLALWEGVVEVVDDGNAREDDGDERDGQSAVHERVTLRPADAVVEHLHRVCHSRFMTLKAFILGRLEERLRKNSSLA